MYQEILAPLHRQREINEAIQKGEAQITAKLQQEIQANRKAFEQAVLSFKGGLDTLAASLRTVNIDIYTETIVSRKKDVMPVKKLNLGKYSDVMFPSLASELENQIKDSQAQVQKFLDAIEIEAVTQETEDEQLPIGEGYEKVNIEDEIKDALSTEAPRVYWAWQVLEKLKKQYDLYKSKPVEGRAQPYYVFVLSQGDWQRYSTMCKIKLQKAEGVVQFKHKQENNWKKRFLEFLLVIDQDPKNFLICNTSLNASYAIPGEKEVTLKPEETKPDAELDTDTELESEEDTEAEAEFESEDETETPDDESQESEESRRDWQKSCDLYFAFKKENGRWPERNKNPKTPEEIKEYRLASWSNIQRQGRKNMSKDNYKGHTKLSHEQEKILRKLGFDFCPKETDWLNNFEDYFAFRAKNGKYPKTIQNPKTPKEHEEKFLAFWATNQRSNYKKIPKDNLKNTNKVTLEQEKLLKEMGFDFCPDETVWWDNFEDYFTFKAKNGRWPKVIENPDTPKKIKESKLATWAGTNRQSYKKGNLSFEQIAILKEINFDFCPKETVWWENFEDYFAFKAKNGRWPRAIEKPKNDVENKEKLLAGWASNQRLGHNKDTENKRRRLSSENDDLLKEMGFDFCPDETVWQENFEDYFAFKVKNGRYPKEIKTPKNKEDINEDQLAIWATSQRSKKEKLFSDKIKMLNEIGFDFCPMETEWYNNFEDYFAFQIKQKRRPMVINNPKNSEEIEEARLAVWAGAQRQGYKNMQRKNYKTIYKLSTEHEKVLCELGFDFNSHNKAKWFKNFENYFAFQTKNQRCPKNIENPKTPEEIKENQLITWADRQRQSYKKGKLSQEKIKMLNVKGFDWKSAKSEA